MISNGLHTTPSFSAPFSGGLQQPSMGMDLQQLYWMLLQVMNSNQALSGMMAPGNAMLAPQGGSAPSFGGGGGGGNDFSAPGGALSNLGGFLGNSAPSSPALSQASLPSNFSSPLSSYSEPRIGNNVSSAVPVAPAAPHAPQAPTPGLGYAPNLRGGTGRIAMANDILELHRAGRVGLMSRQVSGVRDTASALHSIQQAARGVNSHVSSYGHGKRSTPLDSRTLGAIKSLAEKYQFNITSITGGKHSRNSRHYAGLAFDVNRINGRKVNSSHPEFRAFMADARKLGATEVIGPGTKGHSGHVHVGFPRNGDHNLAYTAAEKKEHQENLAAAESKLAEAKTPQETLAAQEAVEKAKGEIAKAETRAEKAENRSQSRGQADKRDSGRGASGKGKSDGGTQVASADRSSGSSRSKSDSGSKGGSGKGGGSSKGDSGSKTA